MILKSFPERLETTGATLGTQPSAKWKDCLLNGGFPGSSAGKENLQCGRPQFDPWVGKIPWRKECLPTPVFWPGEFHKQRSLAAYSPWGCKESDMTEQLSLSLKGENICKQCDWQDLVSKIYHSSYSSVSENKQLNQKMGKKLNRLFFLKKTWASQVLLVVKDPPANAGDTGSVPGLGRSSGGGNGNPFQYACLENSLDRGVWQALVHKTARVRHD